MKARHRVLTPGEVVTRAYRAANRGRYADANRFVSPHILRTMQLSRRAMRSSRTALARTLLSTADRKRKAQLKSLLETTRHFEDPNYCWKLSTRCGSLAAIEVARERIRRDSAIVTLTLRLRDGNVVTEREPLVKTRAGWRIGDAMALQNKRMQLTRSAMAYGRRGPRS